ncbi:MAG: hypothetical protein KAX18_13735 [Candidatus Lokiarchaeota archaeon]|nr:hypothetical protein [Candidatus Lokiarchaeota archaeon]
MSDEGESRFCPYCGISLERPYWQHIQREHPEKYTQKETWIKLYEDYTGLGMDETTSLMVISELFNATQEEVKSFLENAGIIK